MFTLPETCIQRVYKKEWLRFFVVVTFQVFSRTTCLDSNMADVRHLWPPSAGETVFLQSVPTRPLSSLVGYC